MTQYYSLICIIFLILQTSQDGGDSTTATSGIENEIKKSKAGLLLEFKSKKLGKRTAPNLSEESDDAVVEPLLQKNTNTTSQSAKYFAKAKADTVKEISKLFNDKKSEYASASGFGTTETLLSEKDQTASKPNPSNNAPLHNYMNTNIFHSHDNSKANGTTKTQLLVEIDGSKQSGYTPSPLIFTTAKIHTDGKLKNMEPVQMTPAPILSTLEVSVSKDGITTNEKKVSNGTSVLNTIYTQPQVTEKIKENTVNITNSNVIPVTQSKDSMTGKPAYPSFTTKANSPTDLFPQISEIKKENTVNVTNSNIAPAAQSNHTAVKTDNLTKSITTLSNNPLVIRPSSETLKLMNPVNDNNKPGKTKDTKMLVDEPRIIMSESKLKAISSDNIKTNVSVKPTKQSQASQPNKKEKFKFDENKTRLELDAKLKNKDIKEAQQLPNKNVKLPLVANEFASNTFNTNSAKPLQQQKNIPFEVSSKTSTSKTEIDTDSSKNPECSTDSSFKASASTKIPTQSKVIDSKLSKEIDKLPKQSANEITKSQPKISLNNSATLSSNKMSTSSSIVKPAPSVSSSIVVSSTIGDDSNKTINKSSLNNSKAITSTVAATTVSSNSTKINITSIKTATSTANTKPTSVSSTKSSTKPSSASSIKSPQITSTPTTTAAKQSNTSTSKTSSSKPPSLTSTKTPQVNISSPSVTTPTAKPFVSKIAQVSTSGTSKPTKNSSSSAASPSTAAVEAKSNTKTKAPESDKKGGSKPTDHTKDAKVSKA